MNCDTCNTELQHDTKNVWCPKCGFFKTLDWIEKMYNELFNKGIEDSYRLTEITGQSDEKK